DPDGVGSVHTAVTAASDDADIRPGFRDHSYGFRPGRSTADALRAAQEFTREGKDWVVDFDITQFFDHVNPHHPRQTGVAIDREIPPARSLGGRGGNGE